MSFVFGLSFVFFALLSFGAFIASHRDPGREIVAAVFALAAVVSLATWALISALNQLRRVVETRYEKPPEDK